MDFRVFVDSDEETRVARMMKRDVEERGKSKDFVLNELRKWILPMHAQFIEPFRNFADVIVTNHGASDLFSINEPLMKLIKEIKG